jgi:hypothetical protein
MADGKAIRADNIQSLPMCLVEDILLKWIEFDGQAS